MSNASVLKMSSEIASENPNVAKLLIQLSNSESGNDIMNALDAYDKTLESSTVTL